MHGRIAKLGMVVSLSAITMLGCGGGLSEPTGFDSEAYLAPPSQIKVTTGDGVIILDWSHPQADSVALYKIYRKSNIDTVSRLIDSTAVQRYTDSNLQNGVFYRYQLSSVGQNGFEGARSVEIDAAPAVYSVIIAAGAEFTNTRSVPLTLVGDNAGFMLIANDSLFTDSQWEPFQDSRTWMLSNGDGEKSVFVKFRDAQNRETFDVFTDKIILDSEAIISEVTENTDGQARAAGQTIQFTLRADEPDGDAAVDIGEARTNLKLYDDGTNGDTAADDGLYQRSFVIPPGLEVRNATIVGRFTDRAGNQAEPVEAEGLVTIQNPPSAVNLLPPEPVQDSNTSLRLAWTESTDEDFASYKLFRSTTPGVTTSSTFVTSIESRALLNFVDEDLDENTTYYYRVYVFDMSGLSTPSNERSGAPLQNDPPKAVTLLPAEPIQGSTTSLRLTWTANEESDFASYKVYRSQSPGVTTSSTFVTSIEDRNTLSYVNENLQENTTYYYRVFVFDTRGLSRGSNEVSGTPEQNQAPTPVTLLDPETITDSTTSLRLSWTQNNDPDFASYKLYRSTTPGVSTTSTIVTTIDAQNTLMVVDEDLQENTTYYYRLYVFDTGGLSSASNEVSGTTPQNEPPAAVTLLDPETVEGTTSLRLSWTQNTDSDFASYKLYRAQSPGVTTASTFVTSITSASTLSYLDEDLKESTTYYYRIYVFDTGGLSTASNEVSGTTEANEPPTPVTASQPSQVNDSTLRLGWSQNSDADFESYRIYRSESSPVDTTQAPVAIINAQTTTSYEDTNLDGEVTYFYRVFVFDTGGLSAGSNEVTGTITE